MAKQIKAIQCPQCGSVKATLLRPDYYKCASCGTEFFLDNDDVNVNVRHVNNPQPPPSSAAARTATIVAVVLVGLFVLTRLLFGVFSSKQLSRTSSSVNEQFYGYNNYFFEAADHTPVLLRLGKLNNKPVAVMLNAANGKTLSTQPLGTSDFDISGSGFKTFANGSVWFITNKQNLYKIDKDAKTIAQVTPANLPANPALQSGWGRIEMAYDGWGDGFNLTTNDGKQLYYYPGPNLAIIGQHPTMAIDTIPIPPSARRQVTKYLFTESSPIGDGSDLPRLIRYTVLDAPGYPQPEPFFRYDKSNLSADPNGLLSVYSKKGSRVQDYQILSPGRIFFAPKVLAWNNKYILITFQSAAGDAATTQIQLLNTDGSIVFTTPAPEPEGGRHSPVTFSNGALASNGIFLNAATYGLFISYNGKVIQINYYR